MKVQRRRTEAITRGWSHHRSWQKGTLKQTGVFWALRETHAKTHMSKNDQWGRKAGKINGCIGKEATGSPLTKNFVT